MFAPESDADINENVPDHLIVKVFDFMSHTEIRNIIAPICQKWWNLSKHHSLWRAVENIEFQEVEDKHFFEILRKCGQDVRRIDFHIRKIKDKAILEDIFEQSCRIERLALSFWKPYNEDILELVHKNLEDLKALKLYKYPLKGHTFENFDELSVKKLTFDECTVDYPPTAIKIFKYFPFLRALNFEGVQDWVNEENLDQILLSKCMILEELRIDARSLTDFAFMSLPKCKNLKIFSIIRCNTLTNNFFKLLHPCKKITHLRLEGGPRFRDKFIKKEFLELIPPNEKDTITKYKMKFVSLAECSDLTDKSSFEISKISRFADVIDMSWCVEFTDKAMEMFMDRCVPCKEFYIRGMENVKGEPLKTIDENMPHLQLLDIAFCKNIPEDTIKEIQRKNPKLEIIYKDGERFVPSAT